MTTVFSMCDWMGGSCLPRFTGTESQVKQKVKKTSKTCIQKGRKKFFLPFVKHFKALTSLLKTCLDLIYITFGDEMGKQFFATFSRSKWSEWSETLTTVLSMCDFMGDHGLQPSADSGTMSGKKKKNIKKMHSEGPKKVLIPFVKRFSISR